LKGWRWRSAAADAAAGGGGADVAGASAWLDALQRAS
jgi:hypothetical protein